MIQVTFTLGLFFFSVSFILTILAVAVQETFKTTISSVGGQDCFCRAVFEEEHPDRAVRGCGRCAGCPEPRYPTCSLPGTGRFG